MTLSYRLGDAEARHREYPRTFSIPRGDKRRSAPVGTDAKLIFELLQSVDGVGAEKMWCRIEERTPHGYVGTLNNQPRYIRDLAPGDRIEFEPRHIAGLESGEEGRLPSIVGIGLDVLRNGAWPTWVVRVPPTEEDDSGWRVFSAGEAAATPPRVRAVYTETLFRSWAVLDSVVEADALGRWRWDEATLEYVPADGFPETLLAAARMDLGRIHAPPPSASLRAIVTRRALEEPPGCAQWMPPSPDHADDSGWCVLVGDEPQEYIDDAANHTVVPVARLLHLYPYMERVLGEQTEAVFVWDDEEGDWVENDDSDEPDEDSE